MPSGRQPKPERSSQDAPAPQETFRLTNFRERVEAERQEKREAQARQVERLGYLNDEWLDFEDGGGLVWLAARKLDYAGESLWNQIPR
jgi:hypothetical protein